MYSVIRQEKTSLRDATGGTMYRKAYLCDTKADVGTLPTTDAHGSLCYVAETGESYVLDNTGTWCCGGKVGVVWYI